MNTSVTELVETFTLSLAFLRAKPMKDMSNDKSEENPTDNASLKALPLTRSCAESVAFSKNNSVKDS